MRVACTIDYIELEGDYAEIESVSATCSRCGSCTESFGTTDASIRRCLVLLREQCAESNYYVAADESEESPTDLAYQRGYADGRATANREAANGTFDAAQLRALVTLCHPDRHPPERFELANRATARLLDLLQGTGS